MPQIWLPLHVGYKNKKKIVFIPDTGDKAETEYLIEAEREKTLNELKKAPDKPKPKYSNKEIGAMLNEYNQFLKRKRESPHKKYW